MHCAELRGRPGQRGFLEDVNRRGSTVMHPVTVGVVEVVGWEQPIPRVDDDHRRVLNLEVGS